MPAYTLGSLTPTWPLTSGNSHVRLDVTATGNTISVDYVWAAFDSSFGGTSWMQILVVDPTTQAIISTLVVDDASVATMMPFAHNPSFGSPVPTTTALTTASAAIPAAYIGQTVRLVALASETQAIFISPSSFLYVDNFRFSNSANYPGNGSDCSMEVDINGVLSNTDIHPLASNDTFKLRMISPGSSLDFATIALVYTVHATSSPQAGLPISGTGPADVWINPNSATILFDSLATGPLFLSPLLIPGGYEIGPFLTSPSLSGTSVNFQLFSNDPSQTFGIGLADGDELLFL